MNTIAVASVAQLESGLKKFKANGQTSAQFYLPFGNRAIHEEIEGYLKGKGYKTIFIFGVMVQACAFTHCYVLW